MPRPGHRRGDSRRLQGRSAMSKPALVSRIAVCVILRRKRTAELANRVPSLLRSSPKPTNREPRCALRSLCGQVGYVALVRATARSFEQDTGRAPHKLSGSGARRKHNKLASSFHGVAAVLAIDSGVSPGSGSDLIIALRVQGRRRRRNVPRLRRAVRAARRWLCGVPVRKRAESRASNGWRPHNQLGHIRTEPAQAM